MKRKHTIILGIAFAAFVVLLFYTRFVNLQWGLPYAMHPDERNMVVAILTMDCNGTRDGSLNGWLECFNPHFFAYGQLPLFIAYGIVKLMMFTQGLEGTAKDFRYEDVTMALRIIAAMSSVATGVLSYGILTLLAPVLGKKKEEKLSFHDEVVIIVLSLVFVFVPGLLQFARFGTTESLLMMVYMGLIYLSLLLFRGKIRKWLFVIASGILCGVALATKISALPYLAIPGLSLLATTKINWKGMLKPTKSVIVGNLIALVLLVLGGIGYIALSAVLGVLLSPYNVLLYKDFSSSMQYESGIGFGTILAFYTRSFFDTIPVSFQVSRIFPFVLGVPGFVALILGFIALPWRLREINMLRLAFLLCFLPQAFFYAKWTRFIAPSFPIAAVLIGVFLMYLYRNAGQHWKGHVRAMRIAIFALVFVVIVPGIAFLSIYIKPDVRFTASEWIYKNVKEGAYLLAETANVVDIPIPVPPAVIPSKGYNYISFDFYNVDENPMLQYELQNHLDRADYVIVNSRRVFANHTCQWPKPFLPKQGLQIDQKLPLPVFEDSRCAVLNARYPVLNRYYSDLLAGRSGFTQVAEFESYPEIRLFGIPLVTFPDEMSEETWTVFDHPVIRIYKRTNPSR